MRDRQSGTQLCWIISSFHLPGTDAQLCFPNPFVSVTLPAPSPASSPCLREGGSFSFTAETCPYLRMATSFSWLPPLGIPHILDQADKMFSVRKKHLIPVGRDVTSWLQSSFTHEKQNQGTLESNLNLQTFTKTGTRQMEYGIWTIQREGIHKAHQVA